MFICLYLVKPKQCYGTFEKLLMLSKSDFEKETIYETIYVNEENIILIETIREEIDNYLYRIFLDNGSSSYVKCTTPLQNKLKVLYP